MKVWQSSGWAPSPSPTGLFTGQIIKLYRDAIMGERKMGVLPLQALVLLHNLLLQQCPLLTSRVHKTQRRTKKILLVVRYFAFFETEVIYKCYVVYCCYLSQLQIILWLPD